MRWNLLDSSGSSQRGRNWVKRLKKKRWDPITFRQSSLTRHYNWTTVFFIRMKETVWRWQSDKGRRGCESCNLNSRLCSNQPSQSRSVTISKTWVTLTYYIELYQEYLNLPLDHKRDQNKLARLLPAPLYICYSQVSIAMISRVSHMVKVKRKIEKIPVQQMNSFYRTYVCVRA